MHGDRAQEVTGALISAWANARGVHVTRTVAKNAQTNGIAERAIAILKQEARKLLLTTNASPCLSALAFRSSPRFDPSEIPTFAHRAY